MLLLLACSGPQPDAPAAADHAPFPYTQAQIRDAMPAGHVLELRQRTGDQTTEWRWTVVEADAQGCVLKTTPLVPSGDESDATHTWAELQSHATYPKGTPIQRRTVTVGLGTFEADCYRVEKHEGNHHHCFAPELPGPPVLSTLEVAGQEVERFEQMKRY